MFFQLNWFCGPRNEREVVFYGGNNGLRGPFFLCEHLVEKVVVEEEEVEKCTDMISHAPST